MKIALIVPALVNKGPVLVAKDIATYIVQHTGFKIVVFYFDKSDEVEFPCEVQKISFFKGFDFSEFDVIHSHMLRPDLFVRYHKGKISCKTLSTLHQDIYENLKDTHNRLTAMLVGNIWLEALKCQNRIVTLTKTMKQKYQHRFNDNVMEVVYNGRTVGNDIVENNDIDTIQTLKQNYTVLGAVAQVSKRKGLDVVVKSLPFLRSCCFVVVGDGPELQSLKQLAVETQVDDRCLFLGYKKNGSAYFAHFDINMMISVSEGFPLSLLEAGLLGTATVCSNIPIFKELFTANEVVFTKLGNLDSFVDAVNTISSKIDFYGNNLKIKIESDYSIEVMGNKYLKMYKELGRI